MAGKGVQVVAGRQHAEGQAGEEFPPTGSSILLLLSCPIGGSVYEKDVTCMVLHAVHVCAGICSRRLQEESVQAHRKAAARVCVRARVRVTASSSPQHAGRLAGRERRSRAEVAHASGNNS